MHQPMPALIPAGAAMLQHTTRENTTMTTTKTPDLNPILAKRLDEVIAKAIASLTADDLALLAHPNDPFDPGSDALIREYALYAGEAAWAALVKAAPWKFPTRDQILAAYNAKAAASPTPAT